MASGLHVTMEDGFYYFKIAQNAARGFGPTFDGLHLTNGYHPLWMFCLMSVYWLTNDLETGLFYGTLLQSGFMSASTILFYSAARRLCRRHAAAAAAFGWVLLSYKNGLSGLEFSLHTLLLCAIAYFYLRWFSKAAPERMLTYIVLGILLGLTFLARLDTVLLAVILLAFMTSTLIKQHSCSAALLRLAGTALPFLIIVSIYLVLNRLLFGSLLPVSSLLKSEWSRSLLLNDPIFQSSGWLGAKTIQLLRPLASFISMNAMRPAVLGVLGAGGVWILALLLPGQVILRRWSRRTLIPLSPFFVYGIASYLVIMITYHGSLSYAPWYFAIQPWLAAVTVGMLLDLLRDWTEKGYHVETRAPAGSYRLVGLLSCILMGTATLVQVLRWQRWERENPEHLVLYDAAQWAKENIPASAVVGTWNAGTNGYWSERRIINLDGVVNSREYFKSGRQDLCRYWDELNITYLLDVFQDDQVMTAVPLHQAYAGCIDRLQLIWEADGYDPTWSPKAYRILPAGETSAE